VQSGHSMASAAVLRGTTRRSTPASARHPPRARRQKAVASLTPNPSGAPHCPDAQGPTTGPQRQV
jgi:hypothetical protein